MAFLSPTDTNIVMDLPTDERCLPGSGPSRALAPDDLKRLAGTGATCALEFVQWDRIEPSRGVYDWSILDATVARVRDAGMKALLLGPNTVPQWCPDEWYVQTQDGAPLKTIDLSNRYAATTVWGCLSPWNWEAQSYQDRFIATLCRRYNGPDVLCIQSHSRDGEALLPPGVAAFYDPAAVASYRTYSGEPGALPDPAKDSTQPWLQESLTQVLLAQQALYCDLSPHREIWMQAHPYYAGWPNAGQRYLLDYYQAIQREVQPNTFNALLFTCFDNGHDGFIFDFIHELQALGIGVYAGSEWTSGLYRNTPRAIALGLKGTLTAPIHPYNGNTQLTDDMVQAFADARAMWQVQGIEVRA